MARLDEPRHFAIILGKAPVENILKVELKPMVVPKDLVGQVLAPEVFQRLSGSINLMLILCREGTLS